MNNLLSHQAASKISFCSQLAELLTSHIAAREQVSRRGVMYVWNFVATGSIIFACLEGEEVHSLYAPPGYMSTFGW